MIGAFGEQLLEWLTTYTFPVESQFADERYAADIARFCQPVAQPWHHHRAGVCTLHPASVEALFTEALRLNMRLLAGGDDGSPYAGVLTETAEQSYRQTRELIQRWHQRAVWATLLRRFAPLPHRNYYKQFSGCGRVS